MNVFRFFVFNVCVLCLDERATWSTADRYFGRKRIREFVQKVWLQVEFRSRVHSPRCSGQVAMV